uniref:Uncharacterized protein n=1 Tax=Astyanax mexicanus TaxID=7994 RepID=A0A3B1J1W5_ASTMX
MLGLAFMTRTMSLPSPETWSFKYKENPLTENRRTAAVLGWSWRRRRQRVLGYRRPLVSQSQQLTGRAQAAARRSREEVEKEKRRAVQSPEQREEECSSLVRRQEAFCSPWLLPRERGPKDPVGAELGLEEDLRDIFSNDRHCADLLINGTKGMAKLMWALLQVLAAAGDPAEA